MLFPSHGQRNAHICSPLQHDRQDTHIDLSGEIGVCLPDNSSLTCPGMVPSVAKDVSEAPILASLGTGPHPYM